MTTLAVITGLLLLSAPEAQDTAERLEDFARRCLSIATRAGKAANYT